MFSLNFMTKIFLSSILSDGIHQIFHFLFEFECVIQTLYVNIQKQQKKDLIMCSLQYKKEEEAAAEKWAAMKRAYRNIFAYFLIQMYIMQMAETSSAPTLSTNRKNSQQFSSINSFIRNSSKKEEEEHING